MIQAGADAQEVGGGDLVEKRGPFRNQGGSRCYCASGIRGLEKRSDRLCNERCQGNCRQRCGGTVAISVYETGYQQEPQLDFPNPTLRSGLTGCYKKSSLRAICPKSHERRYPVLRSGRMTAQMCALYCGADISTTRSEVAVLRDLDTCCCGPSHQRTLREPRVSNSKCDVPCVGDEKVNIDVGCGGGSYMVVYSISQDDKFELKDAIFGPPDIPNVATEPDVTDVTQSKQDDVNQPPEVPNEVAGIDTEVVVPSRPVIEPENTGVKVVDVPEEESSGGSAALEDRLMAADEKEKDKTLLLDKEEKAKEEEKQEKRKDKKEKKKKERRPSKRNAHHVTLSHDGDCGTD
nr:hypothetical protein BaRGS_029050 [Batillaria attramentaria]